MKTRKIIKQISATTLFVMITFISNAQDTIIMKNNSKILGNVMEINTKELKYKKSTVENVVYVEELAKVAQIKYEGGVVESFNVNAINVAATKCSLQKKYTK